MRWARFTILQAAQILARTSNAVIDHDESKLLDIDNKRCKINNTLDSNKIFDSILCILNYFSE